VPVMLKYPETLSTDGSHSSLETAGSEQRDKGWKCVLHEGTSGACTMTDKRMQIMSQVHVLHSYRH
jgi:hypothetical protein